MTDAWANSGLDLHLALDPRRKTASLEDALRAAIRDSRLPAGMRLPASRSLARDLGISRNSVAEAYERLVAEGWLEARVGSGTRVGQQPVIPHTEAGSSAEAGRSVPAYRLDLRGGVPDPSGFPRPAWAAAFRGALAEASSVALGYQDPRGVEQARAALAAYLSRARGVWASADAVVLAPGFGAVLRLIARALETRGARRVAVEEFGHRLHRDILRDSGFEVVALAVDADGADVDRLDGLDVDAVLLTPAHQFPTGVALAPARRATVIGWAQRTGATVIEDDYDGEFRYDRRAVGALQALAPEQVIYAGTASKALAPGIGLAWAVLPPALRAPVIEQRRLAGGATDALTQLALAAFLASGGYDRTVRSSRLRYRARRERLDALVAERMPSARVTGMAAGLQCLLELPAGIREEDVTDFASELGLRFEGLQVHRAGERVGSEAGAAPSRPPVDVDSTADADDEADARGEVDADAGLRAPAMVVGFGAPPDHRFDEALTTALTAVERARPQ